MEEVRPHGAGRGLDARNCGLTVLYRRHRRALLQRARALLGSPDEAEDILQEVFLALVASPGLHRGEASIFTLLYQMVTHKALDRLRGRSRRRDRLASWGACAAEAERAGHGGGIERVEAARELQWLTRSESARALTVARLHFVDGRTQEEVAQVLGVSRKTVGRVLGGLTTRGRADVAAVRGSRRESMRASGARRQPAPAHDGLTGRHGANASHAAFYPVEAFCRMMGGWTLR